MCARACCGCLVSVEKEGRKAGGMQERYSIPIIHVWERKPRWTGKEWKEGKDGKNQVERVDGGTNCRYACS